MLLIKVQQFVGGAGWKARTSYSLPMFYTYLNVSVFKMVGIFLEVLVVEHVESAVRNENLRYADAFRSLIVLDNGGNDTRKSESRTVESVAKLGSFWSRRCDNGNADGWPDSFRSC